MLIGEQMIHTRISPRKRQLHYFENVALIPVGIKAQRERQNPIPKGGEILFGIFT
jgi:hypothetical protein